MTTTTSLYPFDTDSLTKGSRVTRDTITAAYGIPWTSALYGIKAFLPARHHVERAFAARGEIVTVVCDKGDLVILEDDAASLYNERTFSLLFRRAGQTQHRMLGVDRSKVLPERLGRHDRALETNGRALGAASRELRRNLLPSPRQRATPGIAAPSKKPPTEGNI